jgi:hypothetical protein
VAKAATIAVIFNVLFMVLYINKSFVLFKHRTK